MPSFKLHKYVSEILVDNKIEYRTGVVYSTNRRVWEHDEKFKKYLRKVRVMGIDMETATIFITGFGLLSGNLSITFFAVMSVP